MQSWVALLRGINVGGKGKVPMKDLKLLFEGAGCENVRTYIQSGNVVFDAADDLAREIPATIAMAVKETLGVDTWLVLRSRDEMAQIVAGNPFADHNAPPTSVAVAFLTEAPPNGTLDFIEEDESIPDKVILAGKDVYLYLPNGFSGSKLDPKFFTKSLANGTTRNWRTITKLMSMMDEQPD
jgi:uncharacterized protein (DUF1697 family)